MLVTGSKNMPHPEGEHPNTTECDLTVVTITASQLRHSTILSGWQLLSDGVQAKIRKL